MASSPSCGSALWPTATSWSIGVLYGAVAVLVLLANIVWWQRRNPRSWRACGVRFGAFVLPIVVLGSFWYIRTWVEYGNPTYPYSIEMAGVTVFDGISPSDVNAPPAQIQRFPAPIRSLASWARVPLGYAYDQRTNGFGATWLFFELPALAIFATYCAFRRRMLLFNFVVPFLVIFILTPSNWWSRFTLVIVAPGAVALVYLLERIRRRSLALALQAAVIVAVVTGCALASKRYTVTRPFTANEIASAVGDPRSERTLGKLVLPEYAWTDAVPESSRVGVYPADVPNGFVYSLFGSDFRNDVIGLSKRVLTASSLVQTLRGSRIDYFVTDRNSKRDQIARANPDALDLVSDVGDVRVYRVNRSSRPAGS